MRLKEFGDFQTPLPLTKLIVGLLEPVGKRWPRVLEPTCGAGNFIKAIMESQNPPGEVVGIELQEKYLKQAKSIKTPENTDFAIIDSNIFNLDLGKDILWKSNGPLLVIGNPPWVTNSELGSLNSKNLPRKSNLKGLRGIDAITGHSNFDIAECIWLKIIREIKIDDVTVALLCKTSVARNLLIYAKQSKLKISSIAIRLIDASRWFGISASACLFMLKLNKEKSEYEADVFDELTSDKPSKRIGFAGYGLISDINTYEKVSFLEGKSPIEWRQGIKHDASSVMELVKTERGWENKLGETVDVEEAYIYPLLKSSDLNKSKEKRPQRAVIITQMRIGEDTNHLKTVAPRLWLYLVNHKTIFESRKSSIYKDKSSFSIFGIGKYSFAPYKVVISGLYKKPSFRLVEPVDEKPVMCDDTCYLLPLKSKHQASIVSESLNHPICLEFIKSITFTDAKRPITKKVLSRIDLFALLKYIWGEDSKFLDQLPLKESVDSLF
ncbi:SAM-dependent methyltransferase [candidate division WOR-3 bacterium]|nr:SAM-dependent methyltransferase [candidate division WOR-3 bacterium]